MRSQPPSKTLAWIIAILSCIGLLSLVFTALDGADFIAGVIGAILQLSLAIQVIRYKPRGKK